MHALRKKASAWTCILLIIVIVQFIFAGSIFAISSDAVLEMQKKLEALIAEGEERTPWYEFEQPWHERRTDSDWWKTFWDD